MIGILIIAHASLAEGLAGAVTHVLGSRQGLRRGWRAQ
jgi:mannose/fructose-specific phosphotransferase system component IIA